MDIVTTFIHAYMLVSIYELLSEDRHYFAKWVAVLLIGVTKYLMELRPLTNNIAPFVLCAALILYSMFIHSRNSNLTNLKYALVSYGMDYAISIVLGSVGGLIATMLEIESYNTAYYVLFIGRILVIVMLYKFKKQVTKIKQTHVLYIGVMGTIILLFAEQIFRVSYTKAQRSYAVIAIAFTCLAALFTILWLLDHYKMSKIQKMYADDNRQMSQKLHRSKEILPMIANYASNMDGVQDGEMRKKLEAVCRDYGKELGGAEMSAELFETTGIDFVDLLLRTKIIECEEQDIELDVFVSTRIDKDMKRMNITEGEITRLLGDLLRNAINAVEGLEDKMILLLIARDADDCVLIRVYDSGIPFPPQILEHFGERGNTTWGTGNGLADMMETVSRARASIEINRQMDPQDVFTKGIFICFDGRNRVMINKSDEGQGAME